MTIVTKILLVARKKKLNKKTLFIYLQEKTVNC